MKSTPAKKTASKTSSKAISKKPTKAPAKAKGNAPAPLRAVPDPSDKPKPNKPAQGTLTAEDGPILPERKRDPDLERLGSLLDARENEAKVIKDEIKGYKLEILLKFHQSKIASYKMDDGRIIKEANTENVKILCPKGD